MAINGALTELQAVNLILGSIGEAPVDTLDAPTHPDAEDAQSLLLAARVRLLSEGWHFNKFDNWTLTRDGSNNITVPALALEVDTMGEHEYIDVIVIDTKLYDKYNRTFIFDKDLVCSVIMDIEWTNLPQSARDAIIEDAGMQFQAGKVGSQILHRFNAERFMAAIRRLRRAHKRTADRSVLTHNPDVSRMQMYGTRRANFYTR